MALAPLHYHGLGVESEVQDHTTLRTRQVPAQGVLRITVGESNKLRPIHFTRDQLVRLIIDAAKAIEQIDVVEGNRARARQDRS